MNEWLPGERIVPVGEIELAVQTFGDPTDPTVLLIAGGGCSMRAWPVALCERLAAAGRYVVRYDHRDTGRSTTVAPGQPNYDLGDMVDDAAGLLDALGIPRAHIVGWSIGAAIAQLLTLDAPERVLTLTLLSSTPGDPGAEAADLPALAMAEDEEADDASDDASADTDTDNETETAADTPPIDHGASASNHYILGPSPPWRKRLGQISTPTLVVHGREDAFFRLPHGEALAREIPGARLLVLDGAGHEPPASQLAGVFADAVVRHTATAAS